MSTRESVIRHINKNYRASLHDYIYVYGTVDEKLPIRQLRLVDCDLDSITISYLKDFQLQDDEDLFEIIKFDQGTRKCLNYAEVQDKLIEMAEVAAKKRNLSHIQINEMRYPTSFLDILIIILVFLPTMSYIWLLPLQDLLKKSELPIIVFLSQNLFQPKILIGIQLAAIFTHFLEIYILLKPKLTFYRVPTDYLVEWWFFGLLEGYGVIRRFNEVIKEKKQQQKRLKRK
ncbi:uncharacterized protein SCDLUD_004889 [Saccharomycodes ludwigii]|uniref:uncharacterized protein n=1 Tax=Saccharomycodes ludwigii TaxID=36035 RepID=UPI001E8B0583|nr:hypothetical protein SCDLUD_004889 [Saccharomycodes ludwigii]KAH3899446.1 hypothetical protein SCDLUD_004889 [Saccharomycodes ludwigii]